MLYLNKFVNGLVESTWGKKCLCLRDLILYRGNLKLSMQSAWLKNLRPLQRFCSVDNPPLKKQLSQSNLRGKKWGTTQTNKFTKKYELFRINIYVKRTLEKGWRWQKTCINCQMQNRFHSLKTRPYTEQAWMYSRIRSYALTLSSAESHGKLATVTNLGYEWIRNSMASVCW